METWFISFRQGGVSVVSCTAGRLAEGFSPKSRFVTTGPACNSVQKGRSTAVPLTAVCTLYSSVFIPRQGSIEPFLRTVNLYKVTYRSPSPKWVFIRSLLCFSDFNQYSYILRKIIPILCRSTTRGRLYCQCELLVFAVHTSTCE